MPAPVPPLLSRTALLLALVVRASSSVAVAGGEHAKFIVIDAGSSGCRAHVYSYTIAPGGGLPTVVLPDKKLKKSPGLSTFAKNPQDAGASLAALVAFAEQHVSAPQRPETPIRLAATAGLRLLPQATAEAILESCYKFLKENSTFLVRRDRISILSGRDEGAYGWLSINFLLNRLDGMSKASEGTVGSIEMGGASSQVTVRLTGTATADPSTTHQVDLAGRTYTLYTHSYLGFGQEQARSRYNMLLKGKDVEDPCFNQGYAVGPREASSADLRSDQYAGRPAGDLHGTGNFSACTAAIDQLFAEVNPALRLEAKCAIPPCAFGGVHQPRFWTRTGQKASSLVLFENFFHSANALNIPVGPQTSVKIASFADAGQQWCSQPWGHVEKAGDAKSPQHAAFPKMELDKPLKMCFSMAFIVAFLKALGIPSDHEMTVIGDVNQTPIEWALGIMLADVTSSAADDASRTASGKVRSLSIGVKAQDGGVRPKAGPVAGAMGFAGSKAQKTKNNQAQMMESLGVTAAAGAVSGAGAAGAAGVGDAEGRVARGGDSDVRGGAANVVGQHVHTEVAVVVMLAALAISLGLRRTRGLRHSESRGQLAVRTSLRERECITHLHSSPSLPPCFPTFLSPSPSRARSFSQLEVVHVRFWLFVSNIISAERRLGERGLRGFPP